jgi:hypothetical protein
VTWFVKTARRDWVRGEAGDQVTLRVIALTATAVVSLALLGLPATAGTGQGAKSTLSATEVGVTPTEVHIAVVADVDNPIIPNVLIGARDGVEGFANYINSSCTTKNKCLAGRKLVVDFYDSHVNPNDARNAEIQACANDFAMVGTAALLLDSVDEMRSCKDQAGKTTGIPEIPYLTGALVQQCSDESFPVPSPPILCDTKDQHPQTWVDNVARVGYFTKKYGDVHGIYIFSNDTPFGYANQFATAGALRDANNVGKGDVRSDYDFKISAAAPQTAYTPIAEAIKSDHSNYAECSVQFSCMVLLRKESDLQGVGDQVKVWDCGGCYDKNFVQADGADAENTYVDMASLPFYDPREAKANPMLANFVHYTGKDNVDFAAAYSWAAAVAFRDAVGSIVKTHGVNALTRANLLAALNNIHRFDADGMLAPIDLAGRKISDCHVLTQVRNGNFVRVEPTKPGTFDCNPKYVVTRKLDLLTSP